MMMTMKKNEFMTKLADELKKRGVEDADDVAAEYEQHFAFKLAALVTFAAFFVLSYVMCVLSAGSLEFWHAWSWFSA